MFNTQETFLYLTMLYGLDAIDRFVRKDYEIENTYLEVFKTLLHKVKQHNIKLIHFFDENYPCYLKKYSSPPPVLFCKGNIDLLNNCHKFVGFSGTRKPSVKSCNLVKEIIETIGDKAIYVSGKTNGIDMCVHTHALKKGFKTVFVLPEGIFNFKIDKHLLHYSENYLVISQFLPTKSWTVSRAMKRNETIVKLSKAVFVIEAGKQSGSIDTGFKAIKYKVPLFVPVFSEKNKNNEGNFILLSKQTNKVVRDKKTGVIKLDKLFELL